ncbi:MAG TPA: hypothetical protein VGO91_02775 [Pyrinomonadaceae bacterium]|nr:hypothetical protein [Pyrinomonadaceae bacterium]
MPGDSRGAPPADSQPDGAGTKEIVKFVILAAPRTGSNWVCSMLNSHPQILCHHEIFNPGGIHYALDYRHGELDLGSLEERERAPLLFLDRLWQQPFGHRAVGFKLNRQQHAAVFESVLGNRDVRKIILVRRNRVKTFVSEMLAEQTGRWESYEASLRCGERRKIAVDPAALFEHIALNGAYYRRMRESLEATGQSFLSVAYEDLNSETQWRLLLQFLGVQSDGCTLTPATRKQNSSDLRDLISNFAQLEAALDDAELKAQLHALEF